MKTYTICDEPKDCINNHEHIEIDTGIFVCKNKLEEFGETISKILKE